MIFDFQCFGAGRMRRAARGGAALLSAVVLTLVARPASAQMYFPAVDNVTNKIVQKINAETVRIDVSAWYLTEHAISIALANRHAAGVPIRLMGDRGAIFEIDPNTRNEFYWLANQGVPIRLRVNPTWFPEIDHWKMAIFVGQNVVEFGSANWVTSALAPDSPTNYSDETALFTSDPAIVNAFKTKFDRMWNDTTPEPQSVAGGPPYFKNWYDACASEPLGCDFATRYPSPAPMVINTARLEPDYPMPADLIWGQGPELNQRLVDEIRREPTALQFVIYRLTVDSITQALLDRFNAGVQMQLLVEPQEYLNRKWPEFWLTHANLDKLWAAGVPIKERVHQGLTHMKTLVTSAYATSGSSNYAAAWQRDHNYFISSATQPEIYGAVKDRVTAMWNDQAAFAPFVPQPPDASELVTPLAGAAGVATNTSFTWKTAAFAVSYDVYLGLSASSLQLAGNTPAQLVNNPPSTYSWTPPAPLQPGTTYYWKVVSRTNATTVNPSIAASSTIRSFTTAGTATPPAAPANPSPSTGATGVSTSPSLSWSPGAFGVSFSVAFGTVNPPPQVASGLTTSSYAPGSLAAQTTYYWQVTAVSSGGSTAGPLWVFDTGSGSGGGPAGEVVLWADDVADADLHGFTKVSDATAAGGLKLSNADLAAPTVDPPLASPSRFFDVRFDAAGGTRYRTWLRIHAAADSKFNDSVFLQYSDSLNSSGAAAYRIGTNTGMLVNLWTCSTCASTGWGWQRNAYWLVDTGDVWFQNSGSHTLRVQIREDGVEIDQIVISPATYANTAPGPVSGDSTIVPKPAQAPGVPATPAPANGATGVTTNPTLTWTSAGAVSFDVSFGASNPPPLVSSGQAAASYVPPSLADGTTYYWQIVARNDSGATTGAVWSFTTAVPPPGTPASPSPGDGATGVPSSVTLTWSAPGATTYDVLLGPNDPPSQVASGLTTPSYTPSSLAPSTTYIWQIVAHNAGGANQGPQWRFTTAAATAPPSAPAAPAPAAGATAVAIDPTLTWTSSGASSYDVRFGTIDPPPQAAANIATAAWTPPTLAYSTIYYWQVVAKNGAGSTPGPVWSFTTGAPPPSAEVVIYAADIPAANRHGAWTLTAEPSAAGGSTLQTPDSGVANTTTAFASPIDYVDVPFSAPAGAYRLWMRMRALANSKYNDSVYVQFTDATVNGSPAYRTGTSSGLLVNLATDGTGASLDGWGWQNTAYWISQATTVTFAADGAHTLRIQTREDGVQIDQIILSPSTYLTTPPGSPTNDPTIVPKPGPPAAPAVPAAPSPADGSSGAATNATLTWTAAGATAYDVYFGASTPPPAVSSSQAAASFTPGTLTESTTYYWRIVAHNGYGATSGPVWSFTVAAPGPPGAPGSPSPADGAAAVATTPTLTWSAPGATSYDVRFGASNPPALVSSSQTGASFTPPPLAYNTTYFWQIVARNASGATTGGTWTFTTATAPPAPAVPGTPTPADGATGVSTATTLTWSASGATSFDVRYGTTNPPPLAASNLTTPSFMPPAGAYQTTYYWQVLATNAGGTTSGPVWSYTTSGAPIDEVVIYAADIPAAALHGAWSFAADAASPGGTKLVTADTGFAATNAPLASPQHYVDVTFAADANRPYTLWLRLRALNDSKLNDAVWVQFSDAVVNGAPTYPLGSTSGLLINLATDSSAASLRAWGWQNTAYWLSQPATLTFSSSGPHTLRIQVREDGVQLDQIVLSAVQFRTAAPGSVTNDTTIVPKP